MTSILEPVPSPETNPVQASDLHTVIALLNTIELEVAGDQLWRVSNRRVDSGQGHFLAFIDEKNLPLTVTQFTDHFERTPFASLWEALVHILRSHGIDERRCIDTPAAHSRVAARPKSRTGG